MVLFMHISAEVRCFIVLPKQHTIQNYYLKFVQLEIGAVLNIHKKSHFSRSPSTPNFGKLFTENAIIFYPKERERKKYVS